MPVTVKTFASSGEAASALSSDRGARYLGGGTLVMRALNEGDSRSRRSCARPTRRCDASTSPAPASRSGPEEPCPCSGRTRSRLSHAPARSIGGPAVRNTGTIGGNLFAPARSAISPSRCWRSTRPFRFRAAGARDMRIQNPVGRTPGRSSSSPSPAATRKRRRVSLSQDRADQAEGRLRGDARRASSD